MLQIDLFREWYHRMQRGGGYIADALVPVASLRRLAREAKERLRAWSNSGMEPRTAGSIKAALGRGFVWNKAEERECTKKSRGSPAATGPGSTG